MVKSDDPTRTQVDAALAAAQKRYAGDPDRAELIARTRRFKSSWIELAESLVQCREKEWYKKWSYKSFEDYYRRELRLKATTVDKLTGSFAFLRHTAPDVLERDGVERGIPSYETIDFLRRAEEAKLSGNATDETVEEVRKAVMDENLSLPKITRLFKETLFPSDIDEEQRKRMKDADRTARRLSELLGSLREVLPAPVVKQVEDAMAALLKALPADKEKDKGKEGTAEHTRAAA